MKLLLDRLSAQVVHESQMIVRDFNELEKLQSAVNNVNLKYTIASYTKMSSKLSKICAKLQSEYDVKILEDICIRNKHEIIQIYKSNKPKLRDITNQPAKIREYRFYCIPIDGIISMSRAIPNIAVTIAIQKYNHELSCYETIGISIYFPIEDKLITHSANSSLKVNDLKTKESNVTKLSNSIVYFINTNHAKEFLIISTKIRNHALLSIDSDNISSAFVNVASGKSEAMIVFGFGEKETIFLDIAKSIGLSTRKVDDKYYIISNKQIFDELNNLFPVPVEMS